MAYLLLAAGVVTTGLRAPCSPHLLLFRCRPMLTSYSTAAGPCSGHLLLYRCRPMLRAPPTLPLQGRTLPAACSAHVPSLPLQGRRAGA